MFSLSKKTEYSLLALIHLSGLEPGQMVNVSEIARSTMIPKDLLAKILSDLVRAKLAISYPGPTGGFRLARPATQISLAEVLRISESKTGLLECMSENGKCTKTEYCIIRSPMARLNLQFKKIFEDTMLTDLITAQDEQRAPLQMAISPDMKGDE
jgi:Rrf2 family nitric oxide-sensitive transcriptional repressor